MISYEDGLKANSRFHETLSIGDLCDSLLHRNHNTPDRPEPDGLYPKASNSPSILQGDKFVPVFHMDEFIVKVMGMEMMTN